MAFVSSFYFSYNWRDLYQLAEPSPELRLFHQDGLRDQERSRDPVLTHLIKRPTDGAARLPVRVDEVLIQCLSISRGSSSVRWFAASACEPDIPNLRLVVNKSPYDAFRQWF